MEHAPCISDILIPIDDFKTIWRETTMPNIKSAIKRVSVTERKTLRNKMVKSATKTAMKKFNNDMSNETMIVAAAAVDKAAAKGVISKNAANRQKARMARALNKA